ncbi:MAG TPA: ABC transporter substrate-binding protein, partial [Symbiobacteriaceae bacterium]|nr:ABC transporter substrate-binding protein [Symbiobacteriaceae bacterium]
NVYNMSRNLFNTLLRFKGKTLELEPELLAEMPKAEADNMTYHFKLRNDVTFHNGAKLTAKDVKYSFERMLTPATKAKSTWLFEDIVGAQEMLDEKATELAGLTIKSDYEFDIVLTRPYGPFLQMLATAPASIFPMEYAKQQGDKFQRNPVGTGPFKLGKWDANQLIVLERNPDYFEKGLPYLDKVEYKIVAEEATRWLEFQKGNVDETTPPTAEFMNAKTGGQYAFIEYVTLNTFYLSLSMKDFPDKRVREAISLAIDRDKFLKTIYNGQGKVAKQFVTPGIPGALPNPPEFKYDPARAKQLLKEAGKENLKIEAWQRGTDKISDGNLAIQQMLKEVGIDWEVKMVDRPSFNAARSQGTIPANFGNWFADYPDPDNYLYTYFYTPQSKGMSVNYNDAEVDRILTEARGLTDQAKRQKMYQDLETKLLAEFAIIPIFHQSGYTVTQKWVHGIVGSPSEVEGQKMIWKDAGK